MESTRAVSAIVGVLVLGWAALGQALHNIEYRFNDEPAVVRSEAYPFTTDASVGDPRLPAQQVFAFFPFRFREAGLMYISLRQGIRSDPSTEAVTSLRVRLSVDDLMFTSDSSDSILVDLNLHFGNGSLYYCISSDCVGTEFINEIAVTVNGQVHRGRSLAILNGTREPLRERTGLLAGLGESKEIVVEGLVVPVNQPVSFELEYHGSIRFPVGLWGGPTAITPGTRGFGYATDRPIFTVPDGVRVDSPNGRIRDNTYTPCFVDLDADGDLTTFDLIAYQQLFMDQDFTADLDGDRTLTLFDFLAFQNAFDAGCR